MNIKVEQQPNCRVKIHVEVPPAVVVAERKEILKKVSGQVKLPGYRPGKVPASIVAQRFGQHVDAELKDSLVNKGCHEAIQTEKLSILNLVSVTETKFHEDHSFTFSAELDVAPQFELPELKGIPVKLERVTVTEADIDANLQELRESGTRFEDIDQPAAIGNVAVINYTITMDGDPLATTMPDLPSYLHGVRENWFMLDDTDDFLPGFYASLVGLNKGDKKEITIPLPADYHVEGLQNKNIEIAVECVGVKAKQLPELNEEFASKWGEGKTVTDLRQNVAKAIEHQRAEARHTSHHNQVLDYLANKLDFELPQEALMRETQRRTNDLAMRAARNGMSQEEMENRQEELIDAAGVHAKQSLKTSFILGEVATKENIQATIPEIQAALANLAARSKMTPKKFMAEVQRRNIYQQLAEDIRLQKALEFLVEQSIVEEVDALPAEAAKA
jgi:trigger factor